MHMPFALALVSIGLSNPSSRSEDKPSRPPLAGVRRVVFLGDSITYAGGYIAYLEAFLRLDDPKLRCEFLDLGLPSETVSGLTEPGHAGGQFPRPDLHERLDRVLAQTKPDLIVACYGMNDGIYHPFSEARFGEIQGRDRTPASEGREGRRSRAPPDAAGLRPSTDQGTDPAGRPRRVSPTLRRIRRSPGAVRELAAGPAERGLGCRRYSRADEAIPRRGASPRSRVSPRGRRRSHQCRRSLADRPRDPPPLGSARTASSGRPPARTGSSPRGPAGPKSWSWSDGGRPC